MPPAENRIVFAIGRESKFAQKLRHVTGFDVIDSNDADRLQKALMDIDQGKMFDTLALPEYFAGNFSKDACSAQYADIIVNAQKID